MKALIRKELREHFKIAALGIIVLSLLLTAGFHAGNESLEQIASGNFGYGQNERLQPLLSTSLLTSTAFFCAIFGAVLGWLQIHAERHKDLWGFLVHRPIPRGTIFFGKVVAGLLLYTLAAGLPLLVLFAIAAAPGHVAAPFEWEMTLPLTGYFLSGIVYYFAGLLTGIRQARWYASRGLGLGAGVIVSVGVAGLPEFWQALLLILGGGIVLMTAAWASFLTNGYFRNQPLRGKLALSLSFGLGSAVVLFTVIGFLSSFFFSRDFRNSSYYTVDKDGIIYKVTHANRQTQITDVNGKPVMDPKTGADIQLVEFNRRITGGSSISPDFGDSERQWSGYQSWQHYFILWRATPETLWYWTRAGRLTAYDPKTRRVIGTLEPPGYNAASPSTGERFHRPVDYYSTGTSGPRTLATRTTAYRIDLENRTLKPLVVATNNDRITAATDISQMYSVVVRRHDIALFAADDRLLWRIPYEPTHPTYGSITVYFNYDVPDEHMVWIHPSWSVNEKQGWKLPTRVYRVKFGTGVSSQTNLASLDLPAIPPIRGMEREEKTIAIVAPPLGISILYLLTRGRGALDGLSTIVMLCLVSATVCTLVSLWLGWRRRVPGRARFAWALCTFSFGIPGLITYLAVQEWPAREACPSCGKLRAVDREHCEHCHAEFPPPPKNGTEIFEPLKTG